ncbi:MAG: hypothetical protein ACRDPC_05210 [Solirubrobacteraceae bacterium]
MRVPFGTVALLAATAVAATAFGYSNTISTVAGTGVDGTLGDGGPAALAQLRSPEDVAPLLDGGYLVADYADRVVRKVDKDGTITRVAGDGSGGSGGAGGDGGPALSASFTPASVSATSDGGFLIADRDNHRIRKVSKDGTIETIAGDGNGAFAGDGGPATAASLLDPQDALELADGSILIADTGNSRIRRVGTDGVITTVAGVATVLDSPTDLTALPDGGYAVLDEGSTEVHRVDKDGVITRIAGPLLDAGDSDGESETDSPSARPTGVAALADGGFLIADAGDHRIRRIAPDGTVSTAAGTGSAGSAGDGGDAAAAQLSGPYDVGVSPGGGYYIADAGNHAIRFVGSGDLPAVGPGGADVVPPPPPVITSSPPPAGTDATPSWSFTLPEAGSTAWCRLKSGGTIVSDWTPCTSPARYDLSGRPDGEYRFDVKAKDAAGNSSASATSTYAIDRPDPAVPGVPAAPVITASPPDEGSGEHPSWSFTVEQGATAQCRLERSGVVLSGWAACTSPASFDLTEHQNGEYDFLVRAVGALGTPGAAATHRYNLIRSLGKVPEVGRNKLPAGSPEPKLGRSVSAVPAAGVVRVRLPGKRGFVALEDAEAVPVGTIFDARYGEVALSTALDRDGNTQTALFRGGKFDVRQRRRGRGRTHLHLRGGDFSSCARAGTGEASIAAKRRKRGKVRSLWGKDKNGRYSTHGRESAATVRGTEWLTQDRCEGTRTKVRAGAVKVYDRAKRRSVLVRAGRSYLARARRR